MRFGGPPTLAILIITALLATAPFSLAQLPEPGLPPVEAGGETSGTVDVENGTVSTGVDAGANATLPEADTNVTVPGIQQPVVGSIGWHAQYSFDLPLFDRGSHERFRLRDADGSYRDDVKVVIIWRDSTGAVRDFPDQASPVVLEIVSRQAEHEYDPSNVTGGHASFSIPYQDLVAGTHTAWYIRAYVPEEIPGGQVGVYSYYRAGNTSESVAGHLVGDAIDSFGTPVWLHDRDGDGHPDDRDNCPRVANEDQANLDGDLQGDACDPDVDGDGWTDEAEEAAGSDPRDFDSTPLDRDGDGYNNTAEEQAHSDPDDPESTPLDPDADGYETSVERRAGSDPHNPASTPLDRDADGLPNEQDNCPSHANIDQSDGDSDGIGDACDTRPQDGPTGDADDDGILNRDDNCPWFPNADQANMDGDHRGDGCDSDRDGDGHINDVDAFPDDRTEWRDIDGDGTGDNADEDDDNDGLSDGAEAASGTDPEKADTDGDRLSDLDELRLGGSPLDPFSPDFRPADVDAKGQSDGSVVISWTGSGDARVRGYTVWELGDVRLIGETGTGGSLSITDREHDGGDVLYGVQAMFHDEGMVFAPARAILVPVFASEVLAWEYNEAPDVVPGATEGAEPTPTSPAPPPGEDAPVPVWLAVVAIALVLRRRRSA